MSVFIMRMQPEDTAPPIEARIVGAVNAEHGAADIKRARTKRIFGSAFHHSGRI